MNYTYEISTLTGTKVTEQTSVVTSEEHTLSIAEFAKGSYLITIKLENGAVVKKNIAVK